MTPSASQGTVYNDGQIQYGSRIEIIKYTASPSNTAVVNFATNRGTYIFEDISVSRPTRKIQQRDEIGSPRGQVLIVDFVSATATIQWNDASQNPPQVGDVFSDTFVSNIGVEYFMIESLDEPKKMDDYWKSNAKFTKIVNPTVAPNFTPS